MTGRMGGRRPVVMDGGRRFASCRDAARWLIRETGVSVSANSLASDISAVLCRGRGTVYGHTFADVHEPMDAAEMEALVGAQRRALLSMWREMDAASLRGRAPDAADVERWARRLRALGMEVE